MAACSYQFGLGKLEPIFGDVVEVALHSRWSEAIDERGQRLTHGKHWCGLRHHSLSIHEPKWRVMPQMAVADSLNHRTIAAVVLISSPLSFSSRSALLSRLAPRLRAPLPCSSLTPDSHVASTGKHTEAAKTKEESHRRFPAGGGKSNCGEHFPFRKRTMSMADHDLSSLIKVTIIHSIVETCLSIMHNREP